MPKLNFSAVILAKNEEKNIIACLKSLAWCDEIVVIDDYSVDKTLSLIKRQPSPASPRQSRPPTVCRRRDREGRASLKRKTKIFQRKLNGDFAAQRNFGLKKARGEWVLFVDADERVSPALRDEILKLSRPRQGSAVRPRFAGGETGKGGQTSNLKHNGFYLKRIDFWGGRQLKHGETGKIRLLRLARKNAGHWVRKVHETWQVEGKIGELRNPLEHYPHQTLSEFFEEVNCYSTLHAEQKRSDLKRSDLLRIVLFPIVKFVDNYLIKQGFRDGMPGFVVAFMMSLHSFLAWSKLYLLQNRNQPKA